MQTQQQETKEIIINNNDNNYSDPLFERKLENTTEGLNRDCFNWLEKVAKFSKNNVTCLTSYITLS